VEKDIVLKVSGLYKNYGKTKAIADINLSVYRGDVYGFLGPNGSGKTTTIRTIVGLISATQGEVEICGHNVKTNFEDALAGVGAVVENPTAYQYLSARNNLRMHADILGIPYCKVEELLVTVNLMDRADDKVSKYSLGMKQRLGIAQALLGDPQLIILDEPTNGLDPAGTIEIRELIKRLSKEQKITFFISSHLLHEVELVCNRVSILRKGKVVTEGIVSELLSSDREQLKVSVDDVQRSQEILADADYIHELIVEDNCLMISADKDKSSAIAKLLVSGDVMVNSIAPVPRTLESIFMDMTTGEEGDQIA